MISHSYQALAAGIGMQVVQFLFPECFCHDRLGMSAGLPKTPGAVDCRSFTQNLRKTRRQALGTEIAKRASRELNETFIRPQRILELCLYYDLIHRLFGSSVTGKFALVSFRCSLCFQFRTAKFPWCIYARAALPYLDGTLSCIFEHMRTINRRTDVSQIIRWQYPL